jgi:uncharacterized repeat protein (TIGR01451 family)
LGDDVISDPLELRAKLRSSDEHLRQWAALGANLGLDGSGIYGEHADFANATVTSGPFAGMTAGELFAIGETADVTDALTQLNEGFGGCDVNIFVVWGEDTDADGVPTEEDCDDMDATIGALVDYNDLSADNGAYETPAQLGETWYWDGDSSYNTDGGQAAQLGDTEWGSDLVIISEITSQGTEPGCGFDCEQACDPYVPEDDCYTDYQAIALGILSFEVTGTGVATFTNSDSNYDICLEGFAMWDAVDTQGLFVGEDVLLGETFRIPAGDTLDVHYGSWTTDNGTYSPFLDEASFWCYQHGTNISVGVELSTIGAWLPEELRTYITTTTDTDNDGVDDDVDWVDGLGVQAQHNIWDYQNANSVVAIGKLAESTASGTVETTVTIENRGAVGTGNITVTDTVPKNWELVSCDVTPNSETQNGDGTTELQWTGIQLDACTDDCATVADQVITCDITSTLAVDQVNVELPAAEAEEGGDTAYSMPAAAFDYDHDADGTIDCAETERWRLGVLGRAYETSNPDEGFAGYRCALSSNRDEDCYDSGTFLQIAAFLDEAEDNISSECEQSCTNTTFDQLAREDHDGDVDPLTEDVTMKFWMVGDELYCSAEDDAGNVVTASASATYFDSGTSGMSTLNNFGDYDDITVCEALQIPE